MKSAYIIDAVRSPRARAKPNQGALSGVHPQELLVQAINHLVDRCKIDKKDIDDLVVGCVSQVKEQGANLARNTVLAADWPVEVPGVVLNRFCGSGLQAVNFACMGVMSGMQDLVVAGGVESMSRVPMASDGGGMDGNNTHLRTKHFQVPQGISADLIATLEGFSRSDLDSFAIESHRRAHQAQTNGWLDKSLFAVRNPSDSSTVLAKDDHIRPDSNLERLGQLAASFEEVGRMKVGPKGETFDEIALKRYPQAQKIAHVHSAGNSSGIVDGAAGVLIASEEYVARKGLKARAKIKAIATYGDEPVIMLTAPTPASQKALKKCGMAVKDIDLWEINEAFAAIPLQVMRKLNLPHDKVNVNGGSIAFGHPLGATGAILLGTVLDELERRNLATALITLCIGGGQGIATVIERC
jgi:acetyl-CoA C-acetyltransferase